MNTRVLDVSTMLWMYEFMVLSRKYEESINLAYMEGKQPVFNVANGPIPGEMHLSMGQEPCAVGICAHLDNEDVVSATHRAHHIALAKGVDINAMTAEIFGKSTGLSGGHGGHMHLFDGAANFSCSGIVGEGIAPAVGAALAKKMRNVPGIAVAFIGEGAVNQGAFHESMNLAAVWSLPFICVIEDNSYGISVPKNMSTSVPRNDVRAKAYGIPGEYISGNDPVLIHEAMARACEHTRSGLGPYLLELETDRLNGHFIGDVQPYRPEEDLADIVARDPLSAFKLKLLGMDEVSEQRLAEYEESAELRVREAIEFAKGSALPVPEQALSHVFC